MNSNITRGLSVPISLVCMSGGGGEGWEWRDRKCWVEPMQPTIEECYLCIEKNTHKIKNRKYIKSFTGHFLISFIVKAQIN